MECLRRDDTPREIHLVFGLEMQYSPERSRAALFLQEAGFQYDTAALDLAINLLGVLSQADTLHLGAALDDHRRATHLQILDNGHRVAVEQFSAIAVLGYVSTCSGSCVLAIELVSAIGTNIQRPVKIYILAPTFRAFGNFTHKNLSLINLNYTVLQRQLAAH